MKEITFVIADDAVFMREVLKRMINETEGYTVIGEAGNGTEAIRMAKTLHPDVMTLDITMPEMDGVSALKQIMEVSPETRVIMVSAMGQKSMVYDAIEHGARDFIVKPFEKSRIIQAIRNVMAR